MPKSTDLRLNQDIDGMEWTEAIITKKDYFKRPITDKLKKNKCIRQIGEKKICDLYYD